MNVRALLAKNYINFRGWSTKRKIVIIESDDWGSVRIANAEVADKLANQFPEGKKSPFLEYDGLERKEDLELLLDVLDKYKDVKGNSPVITALSLTCNPDFELIDRMGEYHSETIEKTYQNYGEDELLQFWITEGIKKNLLFPQFHGKEHLFPERYFPRIQDENDTEHFAFINNSILGSNNSLARNKNFLAAFEYHNDRDKKNIEIRTEEGLNEFEELFGYRSVSFCPSQSIYGDHIFKVLKDNGVLAIQAGQQFVPHNMTLKKVDHLWGDKTSNGIVFWRRNCTFEPSKTKKPDFVNECLKEIEIAFRWGKPAVINSHRVNYTSRVKTDVRDITLVNLDKMLKIILKKWPDVEFLNSADLAKLMNIEN